MNGQGERPRPERPPGAAEVILDVLADMPWAFTKPPWVANDDPSEGQTITREQWRRNQRHAIPAERLGPQGRPSTRRSR